MHFLYPFISVLCTNSSLRNNRTRIHKNLFVAMVIQVIIRLTLYLDQAIMRSSGMEMGHGGNHHGIDNTVCCLFVCMRSAFYYVTLFQIN